MRSRAELACAWLIALGACATPFADDGTRPYSVDVPRHFPPLPQDDYDGPLTAAKVDLGRHLFYDAKLSGNGTEACASCHRQELAFTDGRAHAIGSTGQAGTRSAQGLANVAWRSTFTWENPLLVHLSQQALVPMFGDQPVELGVRGDGQHLVEALRATPAYRGMFARAWPEDGDPITIGHVTRALAAFERTLVSARSPYDRWLEGDRSALGASEQRGMALFFSDRLGCGGCHSGFDLTDASSGAPPALDDPDGAPFHDTALYDVDGHGAYPTSTGLYGFTGRPSDMGRFRTPSLRNVAVTAPYMHDGSIATLDGVLDHYARGGRAPTNPYKSPRLRGFSLDPAERADLLAFLNALTDRAFLEDARFSDPW